MLRTRLILATLLTAALVFAGAAAPASAANGSVSGFVYDYTPVPAVGIVVSAERLATNNSWSVVRTTTTKGSGFYSLSLQPGTYRLFFDASSTSLVSEWYDAGWNQDDAVSVVITSGGSLLNYNMMLYEGSSLGGALSGSTQTMTVVAWCFQSGQYRRVQAATTSITASGYLISRLPPCTYTLQFLDTNAAAPQNQEIWYVNGTTQGTATTIPLTANQDASLSAMTISAATGTAPTAGTPTISGTAQYGNVLLAFPGSWAPTGFAFLYQWFADGAVLPGQTTSSLNLTPAMIGKTITVSVVGTQSGYQNATRTSTATAPVAPHFADVAVGSTFDTEISWMWTRGYTNGYLDGATLNYHPVDLVSREATAAFLYRRAGSPAYAPPGTASFSDVPTGYPFYLEIEWMKAQGITTGNANGTFDPTGAVTRQAMAAFLYRAAGSPSYTPPGSASFIDVSTGAAFRKEIEWLKTQGITNGYPESGGQVSFHPVEAVSRQAMAAFLYRSSAGG